MTRFILYLIRWQLSTPILAACCYYMADLGVTVSTILANLIGGFIFFWTDKWIFRKGKNEKSI